MKNNEYEPISLGSPIEPDDEIFLFNGYTDEWTKFKDQDVCRNYIGVIFQNRPDEKWDNKHFRRKKK